MSKINKIFEEDKNNSSNKDNYSIILDYSIKNNINKNSSNSLSSLKRNKKINSNNQKLCNDNIINLKNQENSNKNQDLVKKEKIIQLYDFNGSKVCLNNNEKNGSYNNMNDKIEQTNSEINKFKTQQNIQNLSSLETNYKKMTKELEELKNESSYLKYKLELISRNHNTIDKVNKNFNSAKSYNKNKKVYNNSFINQYNYPNRNNTINGSENKKNRFQILNINSEYKSTKKKQKGLLKLNDVRAEWSNKIPLLSTFFDKKKEINIKNNNNTFYNSLPNIEKESIKKQNTYISFSNKKRLNNKTVRKSLTQSKFMFKNNEKINNNIKLVNALNEKNKLIAKLNNDLIKENKKAEGRISLLIKDKNMINEKIYLMQKEKEEYKNRISSKIKKYINDLNYNQRTIKELYNERNKILKSKKQSELLNQKLKKMIIEKRFEYENIHKKRNNNISIYSAINNNNFFQNLNKGNKEIKNQIVFLPKRLETNKNIKQEIGNCIQNGNDILNQKENKISNNSSSFLSIEKKDSNGEITNMNKKTDNKEISNIFNALNGEKQKIDEIKEIENQSIDTFEIKENNCENENNFHSNLNQIEQNENVIINNEEINIFNKYLNTISENKKNQIKLSELEKEIVEKDEKIKKLEENIKQCIKNKELIIEKIEKEKDELKKLLDMESQ